MKDREPCACGAATAPGRWRCDTCQARATAHPIHYQPALELVDPDTLPPPWRRQRDDDQP